MKSKNTGFSGEYPSASEVFELIVKYTENRANRHLSQSQCKTLVFADCMFQGCRDNCASQNFGLKIAQMLYSFSLQYPKKRILVFLRSNSKSLSAKLPENTTNFTAYVSSEGEKEYLNDISSKISACRFVHTLLAYDPCGSPVDWDSILPFFNTWGDVIFNLTVPDAASFSSAADKPEFIKRMEAYIHTPFENIFPYGSDKQAYETQIDFITENMRLHRSEEYYVAAYPFFDKNEEVIYNPVLYTSDRRGFALFKSLAWQIFGEENQPECGHSRYCLTDIARFLQKRFDGLRGVSFDKAWNALSEHPVFPSEGFKGAIKNKLRTNCGTVIGRSVFHFKSSDLYKNQR